MYLTGTLICDGYANVSGDVIIDTHAYKLSLKGNLTICGKVTVECVNGDLELITPFDLVIDEGKITKPLITITCPGTELYGIAITDTHIFYWEESVCVTIDEFMKVDDYKQTDEYIEQTYEVTLQCEDNSWYRDREGDYNKEREEMFNKLLTFKPMIKQLIEDRG